MKSGLVNLNPCLVQLKPGFAPAVGIVCNVEQVWPCRCVGVDVAALHDSGICFAMAGADQANGGAWVSGQEFDQVAIAEAVADVGLVLTQAHLQRLAGLTYVDRLTCMRMEYGVDAVRHGFRRLV